MTSASSAKVGLVTGGALRVGRGITLALHKEGWNVVVHCNSSVAAANQLRDDLNGLREDSATVISGDLSKNVSGTAKRIVEESASKWGRLDLVVNGASTFHSSTLEELSDADWDSSMDVNVKAAVFIMKEASKHLKEQKGSIVNMCDLIGIKSKETHFSHQVSKAALVSATRSAALSLAPEVRVNGIAPGCVLWPDVDPQIFGSAEKQKWLDETPLHTFGTPADVGDLVVFLSSSKAGFITGQVINLDGGRGLVF